MQQQLCKMALNHSFSLHQLFMMIMMNCQEPMLGLVDKTLITEKCKIMLKTHITIIGNICQRNVLLLIHSLVSSYNLINGVK